MKTIRGISGGLYRISEDTCVQGVLSGELIVEPGITLVVQGVVRGNIELEPEVSLTVTGILTGDIIDGGGRVEIQGEHCERWTICSDDE